MSKASGAILGALLLLNAFAQPAMMPGMEAVLSRNKRFSAEISLTDLQKPVLSVFEHKGETRSVKWSRAIKPKEDHDAMMIASSDVFARTVSDDGSVVVLRRTSSTFLEPAIWVFKRDAEKAFSTEHLQNFFEAYFEDPESSPFFELLLDEEKPALYALWHSEGGEWAVLNLETLKFSKPTSEEQSRLTTAALARAREQVRESQPGPLRRMLNPLLEKANDVVPGLVPQEDHSRTVRAEPAYRFLAAQKKPEDKKLIERLLQEEPSMAGYSIEFRMSGLDLQPTAILSSAERALGDELLASWEGKQPAEFELPEQALVSWSDIEKPLHYLGRIAGKVELPLRP